MNGRKKMQNIRQGMAVFTTDGQILGMVEYLERDAIVVSGQALPPSSVARVNRSGVYLNLSYAAATTSQRGDEARSAGAEARLAIAES